jgi:hypothetical protein
MRVVQPEGIRGSLKWIQRLVGSRPELCDAQLCAQDALLGEGSLEWLSPRRDDDWAEYRDAAFLRRIAHPELTVALSDFWPRGGPQWDGLARDSSGAIYLFEAKAHAGEMASTCQAASKSRARIDAALREAKAAFGAVRGADWLTGYYQYANRLAHLYFLRQAGVKAWLVFLYFTNDAEMQGPTSEAAWHAHLEEVHRQLGFPKETRIPGVINIFVDSRALQ